MKAPDLLNIHAYAGTYPFNPEQVCTTAEQYKADLGKLRPDAALRRRRGRDQHQSHSR